MEKLIENSILYGFQSFNVRWSNHVVEVQDTSRHFMVLSFPGRLNERFSKLAQKMK